MAIPGGYESIDEYFTDAVHFLNTYHWIYSSPNTHIFVNKVLEHFPAEWVQFFRDLPNDDLNKLSLGEAPLSAPTSFKFFLTKLEKLQARIEKTTFSDTFIFPNNSGLSQKKQHEIKLLAPLIHQTCLLTSCNFIIDVGAGLGYLPRLLFDKYKYHTLAIECSSEKIKLAEIHQRKQPEYQSAIRYLEHFVTEDSHETISSHSPGENACLVGLHACADLSVTVMKLFRKLDTIKALVIMPCCYHRLVQTSQGFENFPVSKSLLKLSKREIFNVPFLRLACQETPEKFSKMTEEEHKERADGCLFRAVLQEVAAMGGHEIRRLKRKSGRSGDPFSDLPHTHTLLGGDITSATFQEALREKWAERKTTSHLVEALTGLQAALQPLCENLVLLDRVTLLQEWGLSGGVVKVADERVSPRCHALVASKP